MRSQPDKDRLKDSMSTRYKLTANYKKKQL
jgi:hypothetical protein